jgi:hypothetical protein
MESITTNIFLERSRVRFTTRNLAFCDISSATLGSKMSQSAHLRRLLRPLWSTAAYFNLKFSTRVIYFPKEILAPPQKQKKKIIFAQIFHYRISLPQLKTLDLILFQSLPHSHFLLNLTLTIAHHRAIHHLFCRSRHPHSIVRSSQFQSHSIAESQFPQSHFSNITQSQNFNRSFVSPPAIRRTSSVHLSSHNLTLNHCHNPRISLPIRSFYPRISLLVAELLVSFLISFDLSDFLVNFLTFLTL